MSQQIARRIGCRCTLAEARAVQARVGYVILDRVMVTGVSLNGRQQIRVELMMRDAWAVEAIAQGGFVQFEIYEDANPIGFPDKLSKRLFSRRRWKRAARRQARNITRLTAG